MGESVTGREEAEAIAKRLRALADPTRIQLLSLIMERPGFRATPTELAAALGIAQPTATHHLGIMADEGLVERSQDGRSAYYSIAPGRLADITESVRSTDDAPAAAIAQPVLDRVAADLARRFEGVFSLETVARTVRESYDLLAERARISRYLPSLTARFAAERLSALASIDVPGAVPTVLFVCVQNAGRSQLAAAILASLAGDRVRVRTAGSAPAPAINPLVVRALDEIGVPVGGEFPKPLTDEVVRAADVVVTMGCGDACPVYPGRLYLDWELTDPAELALDGVRAVRDEIEGRVRQLLERLEVNAA